MKHNNMKQKNSRKLDSLFIMLVAFYTVIPNISLGKDSFQKELADHQNFKRSPLNIIDNPFRYTEYYKDLESSLYYCKARYYSPKLMRFISRDTYDLSNRYAYCDGSPIGESDPSGHEGGVPNYVNYLIGGIFLGTLAIATIINPPSGCSLFLTIGSLAFNGAGLGFQIASDCTTGETSANFNGPPVIFFLIGFGCDFALAIPAYEAYKEMQAVGGWRNYRNLRDGIAPNMNIDTNLARQVLDDARGEVRLVNRGCEIPENILAGERNVITLDPHKPGDIVAICPTSAHSSHQVLGPEDIQGHHIRPLQWDGDQTIRSLVCPTCRARPREIEMITVSPAATMTTPLLGNF